VPGSGGGTTGGTGVNAGSPPASGTPGAEDAGTEAPVEEVANPFVTVAHDPFSTFAADVDTASYDTFRQQVEGGRLPAANVVRVEDFVNYFAYDYPAPAADSDHPFAITLALAPQPSGRDTQLLRVGIQAALPPRAEKKPANLVFLVDVSGSMSDRDKLPLVKVLLKKTLNVLDATDTISIVTYSGAVALALPPTEASQRAVIEDVVDGLAAAGSTNGEGGIQLAYEQAEMARLEGGINHVLLCTDGDFNVGISDPKALTKFISDKRNTGVTMTAVGFGRSRSGDALMESLSNHGDGIYAVVYNEDQATKYANERLLSTLVRIAKDMKIQVEFNPELVHAYRLIGYENRAITDGGFRDDLIDAGDIGAGHRVTALYEVVPTGGSIPMPNGCPPIADGERVAGAREIGTEELVRVKVRYKQVGATSSDPASEVVEVLLPADVLATAEQAGPEFAYASAVATLAEILRASPYATSEELSSAAAVLSAQADRDADRAELNALMTKVITLLGARP
jgi:Ca-activated chloride channel family protein